MWPFKRDNAIVDSRLVEMAKVYVDSRTLEEFFVAVDLKMLKPVSWWKWTNPFVVFHVLKRKKVGKLVQFAFPTIVCGIGIANIILKSPFAILLLVQCAVLVMQFWIGSKEMDAMRAISCVEIERLKERLGI